MKIIRAAFLGTTFILLLACNGGDTGESNIKAAKEYLEKGETSAATIELKNALQKNSSSSEARFLLGELYFNNHIYLDASKELQKALEFGASSDDVLPLLAKSFLASNDIGRLKELSVTSITDEKLQAEVYAAQGIGRLRAGEIEKASGLIQKALLVSPSSPYVLLANARLTGAQAKGDFNNTRQQLIQILGKHPEYTAAWSLLGDIELRSLSIEKAEEAFSKSLSLNPENINDRFKRTLLSLQVQNLESAQQDLVWLKKLAPNNIGTHYLNGIIQAHLRNFKEAIPSLEIAQKNEDRFPLALLSLANAHHMEGNLVQAEGYAYRFLAIDPENVAGRKLLATVKLKSDNAQEAETLVRPVVDENAEDVNALNILSSALLKQGKLEEGIDVLSKIVELQPGSPQAQVKLGASLLVSGDISGLEHVETALQLDPTYEQAGLVLVSALIKQKDFDGAIKVVDEFEQKNPNSAAHHVLRGQVYMATKRIDDAKGEYEKAFEITPGDPVISQNLAFLAIKDKDFDLARSYYLKVLDRHTNYLPAMLKLAALADMQRDTEEMVKQLEQAKNAHPKEVQPRVMLARYYLSQGKPEQVPTLIEELDPSLKSQPDVLNVVGLSHLQRKEFLDAKVIFQELSTQRRDAPQPHQHMGLAYLGLGEKSKAEEAFEKALEISPSYLEPRIELVRLLLHRKERGKALQNLTILKELVPEHPEVLQLDAARARLDGNQKEALTLSKLAFKKSPTTRNMLVLAQQNWAMGQKQEAQNILDSWLKEHPKDVLARLELADMYLGTGEEANASDEYARILEVQKDNTLALNNLAWLLRDKDPKQALKYAEQAVDQSQQSPLAMDTLAVVLLKNNETVKAQRTIERALEKLPNNPSIKYHSAMINAAAGDKTKAKKYLTEILSGKDKFPERQEAEALLKTL